MSQAHLAREVSRRVDPDVTRDVVWKLEHGSPEHPRPDLVMAVADALGRPLPEALEALGYQLPEEIRGRVDQRIIDVFEPLPLPVQQSIADLVPGLLELASELRHKPLGDRGDKAYTPVEIKTPQTRAAEARGEYRAGSTPPRKRST